MWYLEGATMYGNYRLKAKTQKGARRQAKKIIKMELGIRKKFGITTPFNPELVFRTSI